MTQEFLIQNSWLIALAVGSGLLLIWPILNKGDLKHLSVPHAVTLLNQKKAVFVDIRETELADRMGIVPQAKRIALEQLADKVNTLSKNKAAPVVILCQTGQRAKAAATVLKAAGFQDLYALEGGVNAWTQAGMPIKKLNDPVKPEKTPKAIKNNDTSKT